MICVEVTETGVSLSKVASDMPRLAKAILKKPGTLGFVFLTNFYANRISKLQQNSDLDFSKIGVARGGEKNGRKK